MGSITDYQGPPALEAAPIWTTDTLLQLRTGKTKTVPGTTIPSAINKLTRAGPLHVTKLGIEGDQQTFFKHGGPDKAVMQYCSAHYATWAAELPPTVNARSLRPGGFGENFVAAGMHERNVCIGDVVAVGGTDGLRLQVSLPRAPCYKLNHRFQHPDMSRLSQQLSRTGWYYRVLREGSVRAGDELRLVERPRPRWSVWAVQEYLHRDKTDEGAVRALAALPELSADFRELFANRLARGFGGFEAGEHEGRRLRGAGEADALETWRGFKVVERRRETGSIASFVLEALDSWAPTEPREMEPGSHVRVKLPNGLVRAYSVVAGDANRLEFGVALDASPTGRGGSRHLHHVVRVGDTLALGRVTASFPLVEPAAQARHVLIAGGVGITAFIPAARYLAAQGGMRWELHLCVRSAADIPFRRYLDPLGDRLIVHSKADGGRLDIAQLLAEQRQHDGTTHVYCCGPARMMDAVAAEAKQQGFPDANMHFEAFEAQVGGDPFEVELRRSGGRRVGVPAGESLLDVLREAGVDVPSSCEVGNCGTCKVEVVAGRVEHRGTALEEGEKEAGSMLCCVSRGVGRIVVDL